MKVNLEEHQFVLANDFFTQYENKLPNFGPCGEFVFYRTYSRTKEDGTKESWAETIKRVVEGCYTFQKAHCSNNILPWYEEKAQESAQIMFDKIFNFKFTPPGRGLWMMGTPYVYERGGVALNNCGAVSTENLNCLGSLPFKFVMDGLMHGVGMGFDTAGHHQCSIYNPNMLEPPLLYTIEDTRESWVESLGLLIDSFLEPFSCNVLFDYSLVRKEGLPIKGFGGISSGPEPLKQLHVSIGSLLSKIASRLDNRITSVDIVDIMNFIGKCVVAGNVRRSAEIAIGEAWDEDFFEMKDFSKYEKECIDRRWASNNTIRVIGEYKTKEFYKKIVTAAFHRGDPGIVWPENIATRGRIMDPVDTSDEKALLINPCQVSWAKVLTPNGLKNFGDLVVGDLIWSKEGWTAVKKKWSNGIKPVYKYATTSSIFYGTKNHRVISGGKKIEVQKAETIECLTGPKDDILVNDFVLNKQDILDGLIIGDGSVHSTHNGKYKKIWLAIGEKDQDYFNSEVSDLIDPVKSGINEYSYLVNTTITPEELPRTYYRKVPPRFMKDLNTMAGFLKGLFSANGFVLKNSRVGLCASSKQIIEDVQLMLSALGVHSYYTTDKAKNVKFANGEFLCKQSYRLNITSDRLRFMNIIGGFLQNYKNKVPLGNCGAPRKLDYDIIEVTKISEEEVFDITVNNESHTYWTQGCNVSNCSEQNLESFELCCLVETYPSLHENYEEYQETLKYAYLYAKTVSLINTHWPETNRVMMKNRRIGTSQSGIIDAFVRHGRSEMLNWSDQGYQYLKSLDKIYSDWLCVPKSIRITTVKPSGTVSLLVGVSPGIHYPHSEYYIRRIQVPRTSQLRYAMESAGYKINELEQKGTDAVTILFPVKEKYFSKLKGEVSVWEQIKNVADYQKYWSDNNVSVTVTVKQEEIEELVSAIESFDNELKTLSLMAYSNDFKYPVLEEISKQRYEDMLRQIKPVNLKQFLDSGVCEEEAEDAIGERYCSNDSCIVSFEKKDVEDLE